MYRLNTDSTHCSLGINRYKIGDSFVNIPFDDATERLDKEVSISTKKMQSIKTEMTDVNSKMNKLKAILYAKFGKAINLDRWLNIHKIFNGYFMFCS